MRRLLALVSIIVIGNTALLLPAKHNALVAQSRPAPAGTAHNRKASGSTKSQTVSTTRSTSACDIDPMMPRAVIAPASSRGFNPAGSPRIQPNWPLPEARSPCEFANIGWCNPVDDRTRLASRFSLWRGLLPHRTAVSLID